jgi:hypothetical protein
LHLSEQLHVHSEYAFRFDLVAFKKKIKKPKHYIPEPSLTPSRGQGVHHRVVFNNVVTCDGGGGWIAKKIAQAAINKQI